MRMNVTEETHAFQPSQDQDVCPQGALGMDLNHWSPFLWSLEMGGHLKQCEV